MFIYFTTESVIKNSFQCFLKIWWTLQYFCFWSYVLHGKAFKSL